MSFSSEEVISGRNHMKAKNKVQKILL